MEAYAAGETSPPLIEETIGAIQELVQAGHGRRVLAEAASHHLSQKVVTENRSGAGGTITLAADAGDGEVRVRVSDTGRGIPPAKLEHIFEPRRIPDGQSITVASGVEGFPCPVTHDPAGAFDNRQHRTEIVGLKPGFNNQVDEAERLVEADDVGGRHGSRAALRRPCRCAPRRIASTPSRASCPGSGPRGP